MAEEKILKPKSFRIDDETAEKFKEISAAIDGNQQETMAKLIEAFEFQSGKAILTEKKADIEQFEKYVNALTRMYMGSLEDNQNITETVRTEFDALLKSKDVTIQDLQEKLSVAKQLKDDALSRSKYYIDETTRLSASITSLTTEYESKVADMQIMLDDKDKLNKALTDSCNDLKSKVEELQKSVEATVTTKQQYIDLQKEYDTLLSAFDRTKEQLNKEKETFESLREREEERLQYTKNQCKLELDKTVLEVERKYQEQIQKLEADKLAQIDNYQKKYFELLEQTNKMS